MSAARRVPLALVAVLLYAAVLCVGPAFHHDFDCHQKSPAHCPACMASPAAEYAHTRAPAAAPQLVPGEDAPSLRAAVAAAPLVGSLKDRSPPA